MLTIYKTPRRRNSGSDISEVNNIVPAGQVYVTKSNGRLVLARNKSQRRVDTGFGISLLGEALGFKSTKIRSKRTRSIDSSEGKSPSSANMPYTTPLPQQPLPPMVPPFASYPHPMAQFPHVPPQAPFQYPQYPQQPLPGRYAVPSSAPPPPNFEQLKKVNADYMRRSFSEPVEEKDHEHASGKCDHEDKKATVKTTTTFTIIKHVCANCGVIRSRNYHKRHPIKPGDNPGPSFCGKCQRDDTSSSGDDSSDDNGRKNRVSRRHKKKKERSPSPPRRRERSVEVYVRKVRKSRSHRHGDVVVEEISEPKEKPATRSTRRESIVVEKVSEPKERPASKSSRRESAPLARMTEYTVREDPFEDLSFRGRAHSRRRRVSPLASTPFESYDRERERNVRVQDHTLPRRSESSRFDDGPLHRRAESSRFDDRPLHRRTDFSHFDDGPIHRRTESVRIETDIPTRRAESVHVEPEMRTRRAESVHIEPEVETRREGGRSNLSRSSSVVRHPIPYNTVRAPYNIVQAPYNIVEARSTAGPSREAPSRPRDSSIPPENSRQPRESRTEYRRGDRAQPGDSSFARDSQPRRSTESGEVRSSEPRAPRASLRNEHISEELQRNARYPEEAPLQRRGSYERERLRRTGYRRDYFYDSELNSWTSSSELDRAYDLVHHNIPVCYEHRVVEAVDSRGGRVREEYTRVKTPSPPHRSPRWGPPPQVPSPPSPSPGSPPRFSDRSSYRPSTMRVRPARNLTSSSGWIDGQNDLQDPIELPADTPAGVIGSNDQSSLSISPPDSNPPLFSDPFMVSPPTPTPLRDRRLSNARPAFVVEATENGTEIEPDSNQIPDPSPAHSHTKPQDYLNINIDEHVTYGPNIDTAVVPSPRLPPPRAYIHTTTVTDDDSRLTLRTRVPETAEPIARKVSFQEPKKEEEAEKTPKEEKVNSQESKPTSNAEFGLSDIGGWGGRNTTWGETEKKYDFGNGGDFWGDEE